MGSIGAPREDHMSEAHGSPLPQPIPTLHSLLSQTAEKYPNHLALVCMHQANDILPITFPPSSLLREDAATKSSYLRWSHAQLHHAASVLASNLHSRGVRSGQPIAALLPNGVEWMTSFLAAVKLGCPFVPLNPKVVGNKTEVEHMLRVSEARIVLVGDGDVAEKLEVAVPELMEEMVLRVVAAQGKSHGPDRWVGFRELFETSLADNRAVNDLEDRQESGEDVALVAFTSGTTSLPKGGVRTSSSLSAVFLSNAIGMQVDPSSRTCCHMPMFHIGGVLVGVGFLALGGSTVFPSASFDPVASFAAIEQERCTNLPCVPAMLQMLAAHPQLAKTDLSSIRNVEMGATTILPEHLSLVRKAIKCKTMTNGYAATEGLPLTMGRFDTSRSTINVGTVTPGVRLRISDPDTGVLMERGVAGEIHFGGPTLIRGYLGNASSDSFYRDECGVWFKSGDQGIMAEDGTVSVVGRYKDLIIRGGENIAPAAIEAVMDAKLGISAQIVGVKSEEAGEVPVAVLQKIDPGLSMSKIRATLVAELGTAFVPENIYSLEDLGLKDYPRTSSGKVRKIDLKKIVQGYEIKLDEQRPTTSETTGITERDLIGLWRKLLGVDVNRNSSIHDFADSLTIMRFRNRIKQDLHLEVTTEDLLEAGTIAKQASLLSSRSASPSRSASLTPAWPVGRQGPPTTEDVAMTLGDDEVMKQIQHQVSEEIEPLGFNWEDDVEDVIPCWDLGYEVFGSVAGSAKVNHRMAVTTKYADVDQLYAALCKVVEGHAMHRSFELTGPKGEPTMRVIMKNGDKWHQYATGEVLEVENPEELVRLLYDGVHFAEVKSPYPSFLVRLAKVKSTNTAGMIWALQHSAFDGLALSTFLDDLDASLDPALTSPIEAPTHIPYKAWADMYYLHRSSHAASRSVQRQIRRLASLPQHQPSLFPPTPAQLSTNSAISAIHRKTYIAPKISIPLPHLSNLRKNHSIQPFILIKAALSLFLSHKTGTTTALFSQNENGRSWPFIEPWQQDLLPNCMDLAGPTLERTVQIISIPSDAKSSVLDFLLALKQKQDTEAADVHAPWNLVRAGLPGGESARDMFDQAAMSTCLNFLPVRTKNGELVFENLEYHETKANCETAWLFNCWVEGEGDGLRLWTQVLADENIVEREQAVDWAKEVMDVAEWLADEQNWERPTTECVV